MKKIKKIINIIFLILVFILILYTTIILIKKFVFKEEIPSIFGMKSFIVVSGSMEPTIETGDIVFIQETTDIHENDIIAFKYKNSVITHRVEKMVDNGGNKAYLTKGDANSQVDAEMILSKDLYGKYVFKINKLGNVVLFLRTKAGIIGISVIFMILFLTYILGFKKKNYSEKDEDIIDENDKYIELKKNFEKLEQEMISEDIWSDIDNQKDNSKITSKNKSKKKNKRKKRRGKNSR